MGLHVISGNVIHVLLRYIFFNFTVNVYHLKHSRGVILRVKLAKGNNGNL